MNKILLTFVFVAVGSLVAFGGYKLTSNKQVNDTAEQAQVAAKPASEQNMQQPNAETAKSYITYDDYQANKSTYDSSKVVYFFNAKWCPTCQALTKDINSQQSNIPSGITIVSVDYDTYTDLKKKYGVTYQHTLVQVDKTGELVKKWSGSPTLTSLLGQIQG